MADTITKVIRRADVTRPGKFLDYLKVVLRNAALDWARKNKRRMQHLADNTNSLSPARSAFAEAISKEALEFFDDSVSRLSKRERRAVILRVIDGLGFKDIGKKMKLTPQAARILFWRAKQNLRQFMVYMKAL